MGVGNKLPGVYMAERGELGRGGAGKFQFFSHSLIRVERRARVGGRKLKNPFPQYQERCIEARKKWGEGKGN